MEFKMNKFDILRKTIALLLLTISFYILLENIHFLLKKIFVFSGLSFFFLLLTTMPFVALGVYFLWISISTFRSVSTVIVHHLSISYSFVITLILVIIYDWVLDNYFQSNDLEYYEITTILGPVFVVMFGFMVFFLKRMLNQLFLGEALNNKINGINKKIYFSILSFSFYISGVTLLHSVLKNVLDVKIDIKYNFLLYSSCYIVLIPGALLIYFFGIKLKTRKLDKLCKKGQG